jgi:hypothetical protein
MRASLNVRGGEVQIENILTAHLYYGSPIRYVYRSVKYAVTAVCGIRTLVSRLPQQSVAPVRTDACSRLRMQMQTMEQQAPLGSARVVLWDPNGSNHFVVGGGAELKMYEWIHEVPHHCYYFSSGELIIQ